MRKSPRRAPGARVVVALIVGVAALLTSGPANRGGVASADPFERLRDRVERRAAKSFRELLQRRLSPDEARRAGEPLLSLIARLAKRNRRSEALQLLHAEMAASLAFAFAEDDDPEEAGRLYREAQRAGLGVLYRRFGRRAATLHEGPVDEARAALAKLGPKLGEAEVKALFWLAFASGLEINLLREPRHGAAIPRVRALLEWLVEKDETLFNAGPHLALGLLEASVPRAAGRDLAKARRHFEAVDRITKDRWLVNKVIRARTLSPAMQDEVPRGADMTARHAAQRRAWRDFQETLAEVRDAPEDLWPSRNLFNEIARRKALRMLEEPDDWILPPPQPKDGSGEAKDAADGDSDQPAQGAEEDDGE